MRKLFLLLSAMVLCALPVQAQDTTPQLEVFGGFSYANTEASFASRDSFHGWGVSAAGNLNRYLGLVVDFSGQYGDQGLAESSLHTFMAGPRVSYRRERFTVFGHVLAGGARHKEEIRFIPFTRPPFPTPVFPVDLSFSETGFSIAAGGGIDVVVSKHLALRVVQIDYMPVRIRGDWRQNGRGQAGLVFRF
jgi:opacity protein-like surface antigen